MDEKEEKTNKSQLETLLKSNIKEIQKLANFSTKELHRIVFESISEEISVPITIFTSTTPFESLCKYLNEKYSYSKIASLLNRDQRTIWYAINRKKEKIKIKKSKIKIPIVIFQNRNLSILENLLLYLKKSNYTIKEISTLLNKKPPAIYSILSRLNKKTE